MSFLRNCNTLGKIYFVTKTRAERYDVAVVNFDETSLYYTSYNVEEKNGIAPNSLESASLKERKIFAYHGLFIRDK